MLVIQVLTGLTLKSHDEARAALTSLDVPVPLQKWLLTAIADNPSQRPQSAAAALAQLEALLGPDGRADATQAPMFLRIESRCEPSVLRDERSTGGLRARRDRCRAQSSAEAVCGGVLA